MFQGKDPRADLFAAAAKPPLTGLVADEQLATFYDTPPQIAEAGRRSWYVRGCNFVVEYSEVAPGAVLERSAQPDEYVLYLDDPDHGAEVEWNGGIASVPGGSLAFVPRSAEHKTPSRSLRVSCLQMSRSTFPLGW